jgi:small GTP-binding protein
VLESFRERRAEVQAALVELASLARATGAGSLAARVEEEIVRRLEQEQFHLVVVGEFNHGKSTFINALLGKKVLPTGVTPTTAAIHHVVWSEQPRACVVDAGGAAHPLSFDAVASFALGGERAAQANRYVEVGVPAELLRDRVVLVDTPGVNDLALTRAEITYGYVPRADAILFVLDAGQPVKESERQFLRTQLIARARDRIVFVVQKTDLWTAEERREALAWIERQLQVVVPRPAVFPVSAQAALAGRPDGGMAELVAYLGALLERERGRILLANAICESLGAAHVLRRGIEARRRAATLSDAELGRRIELLEVDLRGQAGALTERRLAVREEVGAIKAWARRDLDRFVDDVVRQLPAMIERASRDDLEKHLAAFLQEAFARWAQAETAEIAAALERLAERAAALVQDDAHDVGKRVGDAMGSDVRAPRIEVDTFAGDVGIFAVLTAGLGIVFANALLGGVLLVAAPVLALWHRERTDKEIKKKASELAPAALRDAAARVAPKLDEMVDAFGARLDHWLVTAGEELHREVIEVLKRTREAREQGRAGREQEIRECDLAMARHAELEQRLHAARERIG